MIHKFYCMGCKEKVDSEILEIVEKNGKRYAQGECIICGSNLSVVIPNSLKIDSKPYEELPGKEPYFEPKNNKIQKLKDKIQKEKNKLKEGVVIEKFKDDVKENEILSRNGLVLVKKKGYIFWICFSIFWTILIISGIGYIGYINNWDLSHFRPIFNNEVNNNYSFNPDVRVNNNYNNPIDARDYDNINIQNNFTIKICNGTSC